MRYVAALIIAIPMLVSCGEKQDVNVSTQNACALENRADNPCPISPYRLVTEPSRLDGKYVDVLLYAPGEGAKIVFLSRDLADYEDYTSSIQILDGADELPKEASYVRLVGLFSNDRSDRGLGGGTYRQLGVIKKIVLVSKVKSMGERREACKAAGCFVTYDDGSNVSLER
jgi:hypothetical protein